MAVHGQLVHDGLGTNVEDPPLEGGDVNIEGLNAQRLHGECCAGGYEIGKAGGGAEVGAHGVALAAQLSQLLIGLGHDDADGGANGGQDSKQLARIDCCLVEDVLDVGPLLVAAGYVAQDLAKFETCIRGQRKGFGRGHCASAFVAR
ncbi:Uncharacterised protein [Mycobacteroides abscessus subsp. abscessus]|nr:Uncharacterised protein [Mycobacteroides abscessus subsp. abscessus]